MSWSFNHAPLHFWLSKSHSLHFHNWFPSAVTVTVALSKESFVGSIAYAARGFILFTVSESSKSSILSSAPGVAARFEKEIVFMWELSGAITSSDEAFWTEIENGF